MIRPLGFILAVLIAGSPSPAKAGATTNVKCAPNEDRVGSTNLLTTSTWPPSLSAATRCRSSDA